MIVQEEAITCFKRKIDIMNYLCILSIDFHAGKAVFKSCAEKETIVFHVVTEACAQVE